MSSFFSTTYGHLFDSDASIMLVITDMKDNRTKYVREVFAGAYNQKPLEYYGVKLAKESLLPCDDKVDIADFDVPRTEDMIASIYRSFKYLIKNDKCFYVGCGFGHGRTGLYLACMIKVAALTCGEKISGRAAIALVREDYCPQAVETTKQELFVESFPAESVVKLLSMSPALAEAAIKFKCAKYLTKLMA